jgi:glyoxylate/hydroxypyruvate reductase A
VFNQEPLNGEHVFWEHPQITITPHVAAVTELAPACEQIAENIERKIAGMPLLYQVDREKGY